MWNQHPTVMLRLFEDRQQERIAAAERSRLRRTLRRDRQQAVHRPITRGTR